MSQNKLIYIETYGCSANQNNSEILAGLLTSSGFQITNNKEIADTVILNTCIVKNKTENKIKRKIQDQSKTKQLTIITGCMPDTDSKNIKQLNPKALLLGTKHLKSIVKTIQDKESTLSILNNSDNTINHNKEKEEKILLPKIPLNNLISITQISEGCLSNCTFCKTKLSKGNLHSYTQEKIIRSIKNDLEAGAKEIWLTSQGNGCYGMDRGSRELPELLTKILSLPHRFKLRLGMMNPQHVPPILNQLLEIYKNKKMYKFIHLPIQSASNKILKDMKRPYKIEEVNQIIKLFKDSFPNITIATDIITGYPTETETDHQLNLNFITKHKPNILNLSKFSKHKNTQAQSLKELPIETLNKRNSEIMRQHRNTASENKQHFKNQTLKVLVNKKTYLENIYEARDENYNIILIKSKDKSILGKTIEVKITKLGVHHMIGEILE
jgi:MiaB-like tRNA modifying enzyme